VFSRLWQLLKRELAVAFKTFFVAWLLLSVALQLYCLYDSPKLRGVGEVLLMLTVGLLLCAFYTFWPAFGVAVVRVVYRIAGWGAFVGAFLIASGALVSLLLFRNVIASLLIEIFTSAAFDGPCGAHAGGPAAVLALFCLAVALLASPASWWALLKLFLLISVAILLGSIPGVLLWLTLLVCRAAMLVASASNPR